MLKHPSFVVNQRMTLVLALAYGGHWDIVQATRRIAAKVRSGDLQPDDIDEAVLGRHLSLSGLPAPDLLIRTGGEQRVSNFLLWNLAYTEMVFQDWPLQASMLMVYFQDMPSLFYFRKA